MNTHNLGTCLRFANGETCIGCGDQENGIPLSHHWTPSPLDESAKPESPQAARAKKAKACLHGWYRPECPDCNPKKLLPTTWTICPNCNAGFDPEHKTIAERLQQSQLMIEPTLTDEELEMRVKESPYYAVRVMATELLQYRRKAQQERMR